MTTWYEGWLEWFWPQPDEEQHQKSQTESGPSIENVLSNQEVLNRIFRHLDINDFKNLRFLNSTWKELATVEIQLLQRKNTYLITDLRKLEKFVNFWKENGKNLPCQNFSISLQPDYPPAILDSFWKTIAPVVKKLQISYNGPREIKTDTKKHLVSRIRGLMLSSDIKSQVYFLELDDLRITLYNVIESISPANWRNVAFGVLKNSPNLTTLSLNVYGDKIITEISDFLIQALETRHNENLKKLYITGADMTDLHFEALSKIADLKLDFLTLAIPTFVETQLLGHGLIKFLKSQAGSLKTLQIDELADVFDDFEFPRLDNLTSMEVGKYQQFRSWGWNPVRINYSLKLPALRNIRFRRMGADHWVHFLPKITHQYPVTWVQSVFIDDDFALESDVVEIVSQFRNLKILKIPAFDRALNAVCRIQEKLTELILYNADTAFLDEMLTGLNPEEEKILEGKTFRGIVERLVLHCEFGYEQEQERKSLGVLKKLTTLRLIPEFKPFAERQVVVPSLLTFKLLLVNMDALQYVDIGDGHKIWVKELPKDRLLEEADFPTIKCCTN